MLLRGRKGTATAHALGVRVQEEEESVKEEVGEEEEEEEEEERKRSEEHKIFHVLPVQTGTIQR